MLKTYQGGCHCGAVRFESEIDLDAGTGKCNCSICKKSRYWGTLVKPAAFRLLSGADALADYQFGTLQAHNVFCKHCGVRSFGRGHVAEIGGDYVSVSIACLDDIPDATLAALPVHYANGRDNDWVHSPAETAYL